jgi:glycosyltransferase involved in cell wall biosynthesis
VTSHALKILMIAPTSFFSSYGCHVRIAEEAEALQRLGHRVKIVTYRNGNAWRNLDITRSLPIPYRTHYEVGSSRHKLAFDVLLGLKVIETALRYRPDVIHAHLHEGALLGYPWHWLTGTPLIFDFQGSLTSEMVDHHFLKKDGRFYASVLRLEQWINNLPNAVIASSQRGVRLLRDEFGCRVARVKVVPDCVHAEVFHPQALTDAERGALKAQWGIPRDRKLIVYLGLLAPYQGTDLLLQAAQIIKAQHANAHFLIMGYPGVSAYQALAARLDVSDVVTFTGRIQYEDAPRYLALGDVAVAPKLSMTEGIGKVLNYMALGLPTVTFDTEVSREYLAEHGCYAKPGDARDLARVLQEVLDNDARAKTLGRALRQRAIEHFSWERAGHKIVDIYASCLARSRATVSIPRSSP